MRITIDITSTVKPDPTGIGNYVTDLVTALFKQGQEDHYTLGIRPKRFFKKKYVPYLGRKRVPIMPLVPPWYPLFVGPIDVYHALGVRLPKKGKFCKVVTIHDLNTLENPEFTRSDWATNRVRRITETIQAADGIITPSEFTRLGIIKHFSYPAEKIKAVLHGVDHQRYRPQPQEEIDRVKNKFQLDRPYILHIGAYVPRKNKENLVRAFAKMKAKDDGYLVFAGSKRGNFAEIAAEVEKCGIQDRVKFLGFIDRDDISPLLAGARLFAFPSFYEGFGLPIIEAMATGTPVAVANTTAHPEVGGDTVAYFDPKNVDEMATTMDSLWEDEEKRKKLSAAALERAKEFTWERAAKETLDFYYQIKGWDRSNGKH